MTHLQFILVHGTKSKPVSQSRGNQKCGDWKRSQAGMSHAPIYGEYLIKEALAEFGDF